MSSAERISSSRANGAKSRGPKTGAGKQVSSRNAIRHGLLAQCVVLRNENEVDFDRIVSQFLGRFRCADDVEAGIVEEMAAAAWRLRRSWAIETSILNRALNPDSGDNEIDRIAGAFVEVAGASHVGLVHRYEARLHRMFQRALRNLAALRNLPSPEKVKLPNEPRFRKARPRP